MAPDILATKDISEVFVLLDTLPKKMIGAAELFKKVEHKNFRVTDEYLAYQREALHPIVLSEMKSAANKDFSSPFVREETRLFHAKARFMSKFYIYKAMARNFEQGSSADPENWHNRFPEAQCNSEWPVCLYEFTFKSKQTSFLCFRVGSIEDCLIDDYLYPEVEA